MKEGELGRKKNQRSQKRRFARALQYFLVVGLSLLLGIAIGFSFNFFVGLREKEQSFSLQVFGSLGAPVTLEVHGKLPAKDGIKVLKVGTGAEIQEGNQLLYRVSSFTYSPGRVTEDNGFTQFSATSAKRNELGALADAVIGQKIGSRIAYLKNSSQKSATEIVIIDLLPTRLSGEHRQPVGWSGNPIVNNSPDFFPDIVTVADPPTELKVHSLISGKGDQISLADEVYVNYLLKDYEGNVVQDTYRGNAPVLLKLKDIFAGLQQGIVDQRIGSRLLIAIPASLAHGDKNLIAVVDLLAKANKNKEAKS